MYTGLQRHLTGGLKGGYLNGRLPGTFRTGFKRSILRRLPVPVTFSGGLRGGTLRGGFKVASQKLTGGYLKVILRGDLREGLRSP